MPRFSRSSRPSRVQITGALHGVGWKLVLGIEGGAQGNCCTANGFTFACLPPALTLLPLLPSSSLHPSSLTLYTTRLPPLFLPSSLLYSVYTPFSSVHTAATSFHPTIALYWYYNAEQSRWYPLSLLASSSLTLLPPTLVHTPLSQSCALVLGVYEGWRFAA